MIKEGISCKTAPEAIGPYSQGVKIGRHLYLSGQIPLDPITGDVIEGGIEAQTNQVLKNLKSILESVGAGLNDVVKTTVFMKDLNRFSDMNGIYARFFKEPFPARSTVEVSGLPKGVEVEIDAIAVIGDEL